MASNERVQFNPLAAEAIEHPYPGYHRLRAEDPVHLSAAGVWVLSRYDDVALALRDVRFRPPRLPGTHHRAIPRTWFRAVDAAPGSAGPHPVARPRQQSLYTACDRGPSQA